MLLGRQRMRCKLQVKFDFSNFDLSNFLISQIKITVLIFPHISKFSKISRREEKTWIPWYTLHCFSLLITPNGGHIQNRQIKPMVIAPSKPYYLDG